MAKLLNYFGITGIAAEKFIDNLIICRYKIPEVGRLNASRYGNISQPM